MASFSRPGHSWRGGPRGISPASACSPSEHRASPRPYGASLPVQAALERADAARRVIPGPCRMALEAACMEAIRRSQPEPPVWCAVALAPAVDRWCRELGPTFGPNSRIRPRMDPPGRQPYPCSDLEPLTLVDQAGQRRGASVNVWLEDLSPEAVARLARLLV